MVRARLVAIDGRALDPAAMRDGEARRLAEREFNLSWRDSLPPGNQLTAGRWWGTGAGGQFSVESGLAAKLGIRLGDLLSFDLAGTRFTGKVTSLRQVPWDSFRVNFLSWRLLTGLTHRRRVWSAVSIFLRRIKRLAIVWCGNFLTSP